MREIKQEIITGYTGYENKILYPIFYLTHEERNDLFKILKNYNKEKVKEFIDCLETDFNLFYWVKGRPKPSNQRLQLDDLLMTFKKTHKKLLKIFTHRNNFQILPPRQVDFLDEYLRDPKHPRPEANASVRRYAYAIMPPLEGLIKTIKSALQIEKTKQGHPTADNFNLSFLIAKRFKEYIEPPRPYSGPFPGLVRYCFKIAGIKSDQGNDRTRAIRSALKRLS